MKAIAAGIAAGAATLTLVGVPVASAEPTPPPSPGYTWECDTDVYGHTSCRAEPIPRCAYTADGLAIVSIPPGTDFGPGQVPVPCFFREELPPPPFPTPFMMPNRPPLPGQPGFSDGD